MPNRYNSNAYEEGQRWEKLVAKLKKMFGDERVTDEDNVLNLDFNLGNLLENSQFNTLASTARGDFSELKTRYITKRHLDAKKLTFTYEVVSLENGGSKASFDVSTATKVRVIIPKDENIANKIVNLLDIYNEHPIQADNLVKPHILSSSIDEYDPAYGICEATKLPWVRRVGPPLDTDFIAVSQHHKLTPEQRELQEKTLVEELVPSKRKYLPEWLQHQQEHKYMSTALPTDWLSDREARSGYSDLQFDKDKQKRIKKVFSIT